jgi:hypothetical protein
LYGGYYNNVGLLGLQNNALLSNIILSQNILQFNNNNDVTQPLGI